MNEVKDRIKAHEGYRLEPYHCTEGFLTGGYGHKILDGEEDMEKTNRKPWYMKPTVAEQKKAYSEELNDVQKLIKKMIK